MNKSGTSTSRARSGSDAAARGQRDQSKSRSQSREARSGSRPGSSSSATRPGAAAASSSSPSSSKKTPPPYLASYLAGAKNIAEYGLRGWKQSTADANVLNDANLSSAEKIEKLFGLRLNFKDFPRVRVTKVLPDTRAMKAQVVEGDLLLAVCNSRITSIVVWPPEGGAGDNSSSSAPADYGEKQIIRRIKKGDVAVSFVLLRQKYEFRYLQLRADAPDFEMTVEKGKVRQVKPGGYADRRGLQVGDTVILANDTLAEKDMDKIDAMCKKDGRPRPAFLLFRRSSGDFGEKALQREVDVFRFIPGLTNKDSSGTFPRKPASGNVEQSTRTGSGAGATSRSSSTKPGIATSSSAAGGRDSSSGNNKSGTTGGASTMAASTKSTSSSSSPPFLLSYLAGVSWSKISEYGMTGWQQSTPPDPEVLNDNSLSSNEKLEKLFGMKLDENFKDFPKVRVSKVTDPSSRAGKAKVVEGDLLVAVCNSRITSVVSAGANKADPISAIIDRVRQSSKVGFLFVRAKYAGRYLQLKADVAALDMTVQGGKVREIVPNGWAARRGLQVGDSIQLANDVLAEKDVSKIDTVCASDGKPRPVFLLFRRSSGDFPEEARAREVDVSRPLA
ncbi:unnamed protein product [Amoebophrya sp. A120]|nr:unnamed protein product [Amoebophrya sp. A120]|eukprot:GSA120T00011165001.1